MTLNIQLVKQEQVVFLRNQNIFTIAQRGMTTYSDTGTFSSADTHTFGHNPTLVKNVRSIVVGGITLKYGEEYTVNFITGVISFVDSQSGVYTISYDAGSGDKIYPDFPRDDLSIDSFPRIAIDLMSVSTDAFGIGGDKFISNVAFTIIVYDDNSDDLDAYIQAIKTAYISNAKNFYYLSFVKPTFIGPTINSPDKKDEIMQKNIDLLGMFNVD